MFHPIGTLPPAVYWRRRILVLGALAAAILAATTFIALSSGGTSAQGIPKPSNPAGAVSPSRSSAPAVSPSSPPAGTPTVSVSTTSGATETASHTASNAPSPCLRSQLTVRASAQAATYAIGQQPVLILQVTNNGATNCTQDLADSQVELRVYNGAARVWGSHDCHVEQGAAVKTLVADTTVGVQVTWSGLSSQPGCAGTRQRVGAGTYTVYALLAGTQGTPAQFTIK